MKVLAIIGSPRKKGNTYHVVERVQKELLRIDNSIQFEFLFLADCNLKMCKGCFRCFAKGENSCPLEDDRDRIYEKISQADGIILAAPTYAMGVPALMKNFIDRFAYTLHRPCFFNQTFLAVSTIGGFVGMKPTLKQLSLIAAGAKGALKVGVPMPPVPMPMFENRAAKKLTKSVKAFYASMRHAKRHQPGLGDFAYFGAFKTLSRFEAYKNQCPADIEYYDGKAAYFYPVTGMRAFVGKALSRIMRLSFKLIVKDSANTGVLKVS